MKIQFDADVDIQGLSKQAINDAAQKEVSRQINNIDIQKRLKEGIESKLTHIGRSIDMDHVYDRLAQLVCDKVDIDVILSKIDNDKLMQIVSKRIAEKIKL